MKKFDDRGLPQIVTGNIEDAEFIEIRGVPAPPSGSPSAASSEQAVRRSWWGRQHLITKTSILVGPPLFLAMCIADAPQSDFNVSADPPAGAKTDVADTNDVDFVAYIYNDPSSEGGIAMIDELPDDAAPVCNGNFLWTFNGSNKTFTLSGSKTSSSGNYRFDGATLNLTNVVEEGEGGKPLGAAKSFVHKVSRGTSGRITIGMKSYRQCASTGAGGNDRPTQARASAIAPPPEQPTPTEAITCKSIEGTAAEIVAERAKVEIIEINVKDGPAAGPVSCEGTVITSAGTFLLMYGISTTPKGQSLVTARFQPFGF